MNWSEIRQTYPDTWLIIEALEAHTNAENQRKLDRLAVIESCQDGWLALKRYRIYHQKYPQREFYYVHTSRLELDIQEESWLGLRSIDAA